MRSYSWENVYDCMDDGIWATQATNVAPLTEAFNTGKTVVLIFSVNKSHAFQGYAIMKTLPSSTTRRPRWWYNVAWNISEPFEVEWLCKTHVDNKHVHYINNPLNENLPVTRARDGQPVETNAGRHMVASIEKRAILQARAAK
ncbi:YT521-B-like domain-containing protein [Hypoxylon cercidicola]|nr:YT521-B-like domain-containing protein [Hypoxylon cercidicola]